MTPSLDRRRFLGTLAPLAVAPSLARASAAPFSQDAAAAADDEGAIGKTPHTRFAINAEMWGGGMPFLKRIEESARLGFPAVEFWPYEGKDLAAIRETCVKHSIAIAQFTAWGFSPGMNDPAHHDAFEKKIREAIQVAKQLHCDKMTVVGGNDRKGISQEEMHAEIEKALKRVKPIVEDAGVMLILEPMNIRVDHKGHCLYGSVDAVRICRAVASPMVKINWDLYHMQISEGDLCGRLRDGFDQVGYLQLADHPGRNEPGTGEIHYPRVLKQAHELGYRGFVGTECHPSSGFVASARAVAAADRW
ncbi:MAG: TIM barrel protein [Planctomycetes bacterium]|nr:TIM barrel protein [Planctomycetota bacterium]